MEYDLTEALELLGLSPVTVHWEMPEDEDAYGLANYERPNEIWIDPDSCEEDGLDVAEVIAHELIHLWQYRHLSPLEVVLFKLAGYSNNPMELHAEENAPKIKHLVKRIK